jgi:hypothetical protein
MLEILYTVHHPARKSERCPQHPLRSLHSGGTGSITPQNVSYFQSPTKICIFKASGWKHIESTTSTQLPALTYHIEAASPRLPRIFHPSELRPLDLDPPMASCASCTSHCHTHHHHRHLFLLRSLPYLLPSQELEETRPSDSLVFSTPCGTAVFQ